MAWKIFAEKKKYKKLKIISEVIIMGYVQL
jgi:hypothetical protein